jgi:hypothetical protein
MRYVRNKLVVRLQQEISPELLADLNTHFADILSEGEFEQRGALDEERDEPDLADLPRLVFRFNRRSLARFRQMIDVLNRGRVTEREIRDTSHPTPKE